ncbi:MAG: hypothetical protein HYZ27_04020 [Deltaproteobacteria bacterium]|nr:hypothetical protein [Deltaproteobacteria bacterium]
MIASVAASIPGVDVCGNARAPPAFVSVDPQRALGQLPARAEGAAGTLACASGAARAGVLTMGWAISMSGAACVLAAVACEDPTDARVSCDEDRACQDGDLCNGQERCADGRCVAGVAPSCGAGTSCWAAGECVAAEPAPGPAGCAVPYAPAVEAVAPGVELRFGGAGPIEVGLAAEKGAEPTAWQAGDRLVVPTDAATIEVVARWQTPAAGCEAARFRQRYQVGAVARDDGMAATDPRIVAWAGGWLEVALGADVDPEWRDPTRALGPAGDDVYDVLALGEGGSATFILDLAATDGPGPDLAVFENATPPTFHEFAFIEVSSDGTNFARLPARTNIAGPVGPYDMTDASGLEGLAGAYPLGIGTPFDLAALRFEPAVTGGLVDLGAIRFVRIVDIVGDGRALDAFGAPIFDPTPTIGSAGFDLDGIGVLAHDAPED